MIEHLTAAQSIAESLTATQPHRTQQAHDTAAFLLSGDYPPAEAARELYANEPDLFTGWIRDETARTLIAVTAMTRSFRG